MNLYRVTFDTSTVIVLSADYEQLYEHLKGLDERYVSKGNYELYYQWNAKTEDRCDIHVIRIDRPGIVSAVAH